ncbi:EF-hand domain-containing protein [Streptomyces sp. NEAU-W12]|uniref:EF-hand domain-containing protein n=1 Tax=Streptomyces sp. NEAU-W12 TaxID=2994668 RepID=UPI00224B2B0F|nr:EF-hand domain-containing protein [Streptomyces sp. NEAU-W12]MCX2928074.1 EF-hand domain-containing protein [Streptomyces sp. NEAU-W12]
MAATAILDKSHRVFDAIDEDGNGVIAADDFERIAERLIRSFDEASPAASKVRSTYTKCWQRLAELADSDGDGQVTKQEFETAFAGARQNKFMQVIDQALDAEFDLADTDGDGVLNRDEIGRMLSAYGVPQPELDQAVAGLDQDGDGQVSRSEYRTAMREYYLSDDPAAPSAPIFGRIRG